MRRKWLLQGGVVGALSAAMTVVMADVASTPSVFPAAIHDRTGGAMAFAFQDPPLAFDCRSTALLKQDRPLFHRTHFSLSAVISSVMSGRLAVMPQDLPVLREDSIRRFGEYGLPNFEVAPLRHDYIVTALARLDHSDTCSFDPVEPTTYLI